MAAPQDEHRGLLARRHCRHAGIGDRTPAALCMAARFAALDRQRVVEQQHALPRPFAQIAMRGARDAEVGFQLLVDVHEAWRDLHPFGHCEAQAHRLPRPMIGILPEDHDLHRVERGQFERRQAAAARRIDRFARALFLDQESAQLPRLRGRQHRAQRGLPAFGDRVGRHRERTKPPGRASPAPLPTNPQSA